MKKCLLCGTPINNRLSLSFILSLRPFVDSPICGACRRKFVSLRKVAKCKICGKMGHFKRQICPDCRCWQKSRTAWFRNRGLYQYNQMMSNYMQKYKFRGDYRLRRVFTRAFTRAVRRTRRLVVPIPLNPQTYQRRGFNQVLGFLDGVSVCPALATRHQRKVKAQSKKTRRERLRLPQPFRLVPKYRNKVANRDVLVIDDVYTTGTTIRHAASLLKRAGAKSVTGLTLAR